MGYLCTVSLFLSFSFSFSFSPRSHPSFSPPSYSMLSCSLILLPLPPADPAAHPPPLSPSFLRYLISFSHPPLATGKPSHPTEPAEGARLPSRPSSSAPNPAPSAIDTPMRATPRQGRCASHNGRRCTAAVKREDQRTREWPRAKGRKNPLSFNGEREKGDRLEEKSMNGSERAEKNGDREK